MTLTTLSQVSTFSGINIIGYFTFAMLILCNGLVPCQFKGYQGVILRHKAASSIERGQVVHSSGSDLSVASVSTQKCNRSACFGR